MTTCARYKFLYYYYIIIINPICSIGWRKENGQLTTMSRAGKKQKMSFPGQVQFVNDSLADSFTYLMQHSENFRLFIVEVVSQVILLSYIYCI